MLRTVLNRRMQVLVLIMILSVVLTTTTAHAATKYIDGDGGIIQIASGVWLVIPEDALPEMDYDDDKGMVISADIGLTSERVNFIFGPSPLTFNVPAKLVISWAAIARSDISDLTLYCPNGEEIEPRIRFWVLTWDIRHFSVYYHRRR